MLVHIVATSIILLTCPELKLIANDAVIIITLFVETNIDVLFGTCVLLLLQARALQLLIKLRIFGPLIDLRLEQLLKLPLSLVELLP